MLKLLHKSKPNKFHGGKLTHRGRAGLQRSRCPAECGEDLAGKKNSGACVLHI